MVEQRIKDKLLKLGGPQKRISCSQARRLAEESGSSYAEVGRLCDELGIKIRSCELGCF